MECQDVRQLLAFLERPSDELDAVERAALQKHLDACPDCAALSAQEHGVDQAIGSALRNVPVPAGLKQQVLQRLAKERGRPWKRWAGAAAAAVLVAFAVGTWLSFSSKPALTVDDVDAVMPNFAAGWQRDAVEQHLEKQGLTVRAPDRFRYRYLQQVDVVVIHGRRVARLTFSRNDDQTASATVFIVGAAQFNVEKLKGLTGIEVDDQRPDFWYVIQHSGNNLQPLENDFG